MARSSRRRRDVRTWRRWVRELWTPILRARLSGVAAAVLGVVILAILATYHPSDPSFDAASPGPAANLLGGAEGQGFYQLMSDLPYERALIAVVGVGVVLRRSEESL